MNGSAPNCSATGSHVDVMRKLNPNFWIASEEPRASCQPMRTISKTTANAIVSVSHLKASSPNRDGGVMRSRTERSRSNNCAFVIVILGEAKNLGSLSKTVKQQREMFRFAQHDTVTVGGRLGRRRSSRSTNLCSFAVKT